jgi:hypothetical protein
MFAQAVHERKCLEMLLEGKHTQSFPAALTYFISTSVLFCTKTITYFLRCGRGHEPARCCAQCPSTAGAGIKLR